MTAKCYFDIEVLPRTGLVKRELVREALAISISTERRLVKAGRLPGERIRGWVDAAELRRLLTAEAPRPAGEAA